MFSETVINKLCTIKCVLCNLFIYNLCLVHDKSIQKTVDSALLLHVIQINWDEQSLDRPSFIGAVADFSNTHKGCSSAEGDLPPQSQEPKLQFCRRRSSTANSGTKVAVLPKTIFHRKLMNQGCSSAEGSPPPQTQEPRSQFCRRRSSTANSGTNVAVLTKAIFHRKLRNQSCSFAESGLPPQTLEPRLQFCRRQSSTANSGTKVAVLPKAIFHRKLRNQGCSSAEGDLPTQTLEPRV